MSRSCTPQIRRYAKESARASILALLILGLFCLPAFGTLLRPLSVETLADLSDVVARGRVDSVEVVWNDSATMPVTRVVVEVLETLEGNAGGRRLIVTVPGGERDGVALDYGGRPRFSPGEEVVLFLQRRGGRGFIPVGLAQGRLEVHREAATGRALLRRDLAGAVLLERDERGDTGPVAAGPADLEALRQRLRARSRPPRPAQP
jgi:hypothetical protein